MNQYQIHQSKMTTAEIRRNLRLMRLAYQYRTEPSKPISRFVPWFAVCSSIAIIIFALFA